MSRVRKRAVSARSGPSRMRLLAPFAMLGLLWLTASAFWLYASGRARAEIDAWLGREAAAGRNWSCGRRELAGYPFRIEFTCAEAGFASQAQGRAVSGILARVAAVAQVYSPKLLIVEADGPLVVNADGARVQANWSELRASFRGEPGAGLERLSLEGANVTVTLSGLPLPEATASAASLQIHLRPTPDAPAATGSYDVAFALDQAAAPGVSTIFASPSIEIDARARLTEARLFASSVPAELARWQQAGGRLDVTGLRAGAADRELRAAGELFLNADGRPQGRIDFTATGLDGLTRALSGGRGGADALIGAFLGRTKEVGAPQKPATFVLKLDHGRVMLGPFPIADLPPLF